MEEESRTERAVKDRKRRRRTFWLVFSLVLVLVLVGAAAWYWYMQPQRHFKTVPVLSQPTKQAASTGASTPKTPPTPQNTAPAQNAPPGSQDTASFNVLILGIDAREGELDSRSDVIMVAHVMPAEKKVNLVSIPRDTRVNVPGIGMTKINHAHFVGNMNGGNHGGTEAAVQTVSDFLNVPINYYAKMDFEGFQKFIDSVGGLDVTFPYQIRDFSAGKHHLNGADTLIAVRERYSVPGGDFGRQNDQNLVLNALLQKLLKVDNIPNLPAQIKQIRTDVIDTNFTDSDLLSLGLLFKGMTGSQVHYEQIPGHDGSGMDPLVGLNLYYWIPDEAAVKNISDTYLHDHS